MTTKEEYIAHCEKNFDTPLFHQAAWWNVVCGENWSVEKINIADEIAFLPYHIEKKIGFQLVRNPHLTPYSGLLFVNKIPQSFKELFFEAAVDFLNQFSLSEIDCNPTILNAVSIHENVKSKKTHLLGLDKPIDEIWNEFKSSLRRQIRKAEKNLVINEHSDSKQLYEIYAQTLSRKSVSKIPHNIIERTFQYSFKDKNGHIFSAVDEQNNVHACLWYVEDDSTAYYLLGGTNKHFLGSGAMGLLLWNGIKLAHQNGKKGFDFEGSEDTGVARFFGTFGGKITEYPVLQGKTNWLVKHLLSIKNKLS